jgi:UDP-N-acetylmuramoyl-L-alanyl-D-glutamate--2,6-diaminopimelate ligase
MVSRMKRFIPKVMLRRYHRLLAMLANLWYGRPSRHLVVIGVTGTDGKTTTASLIADTLGASGALVGLSTSALVQVGTRRWLNESHMTMPGRFALQKLLRQMVQAGCRYAVIEMSSEGLVQNRHVGIDIDVAVVTNVTPEHIEAHGSFEQYRAAKGLLFASIIRGGDKHLHGATIPKVTVVNLDDPNHDFFLAYWAEQHFGTCLQPHELPARPKEKTTVLCPTSIHLDHDRSIFTLDGHNVALPLPGEYNVRNALQAAAVGRALGLEWSTIISGLAAAHQIPGRTQRIDSGRGWEIVVDYALTPNALTQLYTALKQQGARRIIAVFGAAGGGRDAWKRPELGNIAAEYCDQIILTTDDPYSEDPAKIAEAILAGIPAEKKGRVLVQLDRKEAIREAMRQAKSGDVIAITGMGSETSMMVQGKAVAWSDTQVVQELLAE